MQKKRRRKNIRRTPQRVHTAPPDMNRYQAGNSIPKSSSSRRKPQKRRRTGEMPPRTVQHRPEVQDNTYHKRRRRTSEVKPFSIKEARRQARREHRRKYKRRNDGKIADILYKILITAAVLAIVLFTFGVFFGVEDIKTENSAHYADSEVINASGIQRGDKILFINRGKVYDNIKEQLPFIRSVKVKIKFPTTVIIDVTERVPAAKLTVGGFNYILASDGVLLESTVFSSKYDLPIIICESPNEKNVGQKLVFENEVTGATLDAILEKVVFTRLSDKIDSINIEKVYDISFTYDDRFTVRLGDTTDIDKKMQMLGEVIKRLGDGARGVIDVKNPDLVRYREQ